MNIEFSTGATASFTMIAHTKLQCERQTRIHFAFGEIVGNMSSFTVTDFRTRKSTLHAPKSKGGHCVGMSLWNRLKLPRCSEPVVAMDSGTS